jgi:hypothetical protein
MTLLLALTFWFACTPVQTPRHAVSGSTIAHMSTVLTWERQLLQTEDALNSEIWNSTEMGAAFRKNLALNHRTVESSARIVSNLQQGLGTPEDVFNFYVNARDLASDALSDAGAEHSEGDRDSQYGQKAANILNAVSPLNVALSAVEDDIRELIKWCE